MSLIAAACADNTVSDGRSRPLMAQVPPSAPPLEATEQLALIAKIRHSDPSRAAKLAELGYRKPSPSTSPELLWQFRVLHAALMLDQTGGNNAAVFSQVEALISPAPSGISPEESSARLNSLRGYIAYRKQDWKGAHRLYQNAIAGMAMVKEPCWRAELLIHHQAQVLWQEKQFAAASKILAKGVPDAQACLDKHWQVLVSFVQGNLYNDQYQYENAANSLRESLRQAERSNLDALTINSSGNLALAYYNLGDTDNAFAMFANADKYFKKIPKPSNKQKHDWGVREGHRARTHLLLRQYGEAARSYLNAINEMAESDAPFKARFKDELTAVYIEKGDYRSADELNRQVLVLPNLETRVATSATLNSARLMRLQNNPTGASRILRTLLSRIHKEGTDPRLDWQIHAEQAQTLAALGKIDPAIREFDEALKTANLARDTIEADGYRLTFYAQLLNIYRAYVTFLYAQRRYDAALRIAELGHARILAEKLDSDQELDSHFDFSKIAEAKKAVVLSYSIQPGCSYMWVTTSKTTATFRLPPEQELTDLIKRHNASILEERAINEDQGGETLYEKLIGRAAALIPKGSNLVVIPDGPLANLNFETLIPPGTKSYWLASVSITVAPSFAVLRKAEHHAFDPASLLLVGDAIQVDSQLPPLGDSELAAVEKLYGRRCARLVKGNATPSQFLNAKPGPGTFDLIHFSTHAIANRQTPLESYIVLSRDKNGDYRLYARDLANLDLKADLVTLSACQSAGAGIPGEGLVGLTWAMLGAGAQNVLASLWPVPAHPTAGLMNRFYTHLHGGMAPAQALHEAKLEMVKEGSIPYNWAAFQIYSR